MAALTGDVAVVEDVLSGAALTSMQCARCRPGPPACPAGRLHRPQAGAPGRAVCRGQSAGSAPLASPTDSTPACAQVSGAHHTDQASTPGSQTRCMCTTDLCYILSQFCIRHAGRAACLHTGSTAYLQTCVKGHTRPVGRSGASRALSAASCSLLKWCSRTAPPLSEAPPARHDVHLRLLHLQHCKQGVALSASGRCPAPLPCSLHVQSMSQEAYAQLHPMDLPAMALLQEAVVHLLMDLPASHRLPRRCEYAPTTGSSQRTADSSLTARVDPRMVTASPTRSMPAARKAATLSAAQCRRQFPYASHSINSCQQCLSDSN